MISLSADAQLEVKRDRVRHAFSGYSALAETGFAEIVGADSITSYRTRAKLVVSETGEIGLYARGSHDVVDIPQCQVLAASLLGVVASIRELLSDASDGPVLSSLRARESDSAKPPSTAVRVASAQSARPAAAEVPTDRKSHVDRTASSTRRTNVEPRVGVEAHAGPELDHVSQRDAAEVAPTARGRTSAIAYAGELATPTRTRTKPRRIPISALDLRELWDGARSSVLVTLIGPSQHRGAIEALAARVAQLDDVAGVAFSSRESDSAQVLGASPERLLGVGLARDALCDAGPYTYAAHGGFTQAHRGQATKLIGRVLGELNRTLGSFRDKRVLELYAGAGALALRLSRSGARTTAVERYAPALSQLARAAEEQKIPTPECFAEDAEVALARFVQTGARFDAVVLNPPRRGLPSRVRALIAQLAPQALVYVSCNPDTLARDVADFAWHGLRARELTPYDLMPLAADVESVVLLVPGSPPSAAVLYEDDDLLVVDKPPHLPTHPEREHASSLLDRLQGGQGLEGLRAVHRLDLGTSGVCLFAKTQASTTAYAAALGAGQKSYLALARGRVHDKGIVKQSLSDGGAQREALTRYTRKQFIGGHSLLRVRPAQGRTHQVRRHLAAIGHPVLGDHRYGDFASNLHFEHRHGLDRTFLHLARVELQAKSGETLRFEAALPPDLEAVLRSLREPQPDSVG